MDKRRQGNRTRQCAIVVEDGAGHWLALGAGGATRPADSARAAILRALYGRQPVGAVLLLPPKARP